MKFLDQSGLVIVQSWINNSFAKVDQAFGTINYAGNVSGITVTQVSTTEEGSSSNVYYDTTSKQFVLKAGNNAYYNNWPNRYIWVIPNLDQPWSGVIYKSLNPTKTYKYIPERGSMVPCDVTDYPAMRLRDLIEDIELYIAVKGMYAKSTHTHTIANVTGLQNKLDTINKGLNMLGLNQWGAVKVDGVLTGSINAAAGGIGNPSAVYIAQSISTTSGTISGIVGKIGSSYYTTWNGTSVPTNLYIKTIGTPYYSKYYYTTGSDNMPNAVYKWNGNTFTHDVDYLNHSISDGFGNDLEDAILKTTEYIDSVASGSVSKTDTITNSAASSTSNTVNLAYVLTTANTHGNIKSASASQLGLVNSVTSSSASGNAIQSLSKTSTSSSIVQKRAWFEPWTSNNYVKQPSAASRIFATEGKFSVLDFRSKTGMYLGFTTPFGLTAGMNHHWRGMLVTNTNQPVNIAKPEMLSSDAVILCNLPQAQIISGTNFYFDAYTTSLSTSTTHDTLILILSPITNTLGFSA